MSDIPEARRQLLAVYNKLRDDGLHQYANEMLPALKLLTREPAIRRAPVRHPPVDAQMRDVVKAYAKEFPLAHFSSIARVFHTNSGRISEILNGKYDHL